MTDEYSPQFDFTQSGDWTTPFGFDFGNLSNTPMSSDLYVDTQTGQIVSAAQAQQIDPTFQPSYGGGYSLGVANGATGGLQQAGQLSPSGNGSNGMSLGQWLGLGTAGLAGASGLAGIIQALSQGGTSSTVNRNVAPPTAAEQQAQQVGLQGLQGAQQFAFGTPGATGSAGGGGGLAGQLSMLAPYQNAATLQGLARLMQPNPFLGTWPTATNGVAGMQNQPRDGGGLGAGSFGVSQPQLRDGGGIGAGAFGAPQQQLRDGGGLGAGQFGTPQSFLPAKGGMSPQTEQPPKGYALSDSGGLTSQPIPGQGTAPIYQNAQGGTWSPSSGPWQAPQTQSNAQLMGMPGFGGQPQSSATSSGNPLLDLFYNQTLNYGQQQGSLLGNAAVQGSQVSPLLGQQASGMLQGNLPALNPALQQQVGAIYNARQQDVNRYLDTALQGSLERARQQGFAGGLDTFNEGTPQAIMAPALAEAVRQRGTLAGQQAEAELGLAQSLPMQGANLAGMNAQLLGGLAQQYTTPLSVALGGGLNLSNLNQNIVQSLGQFGQQGIQNQLGFLQALSAPVNSANQLSANQAYNRALGSGTTTTQPFNLLSAFAPTAQLLGGIGGVLTGVGGTQRPQTMSGF